MTHEELEQEVLRQGSSLRALDEIIKAEGNKVLAFRCSHSGLFYPEDFVKKWGVRYGIGLGPSPVSECWDSQYWMELPDPRKVRQPEDIAYPIVTCMGQVDMAVVPVSQYEAAKLIPALADRDGTQRAAIVHGNQLRNSAVLRVMVAQAKGKEQVYA